MERTNRHTKIVTVEVKPFALVAHDSYSRNLSEAVVNRGPS